MDYPAIVGLTPKVGDRIIYESSITTPARLTKGEVTGVHLRGDWMDVYFSGTEFKIGSLQSLDDEDAPWMKLPERMQSSGRTVVLLLRTGHMLPDGSVQTDTSPQMATARFIPQLVSA